MKRGVVAVLGCGPAGLLAAHAVADSGRTPIIFSRRKRSAIGGAQFIHEPIPGLRSRYDLITIVKLGLPEVYARKVYGDAEAPTSWSIYGSGIRHIWSMQDTYDDLWRMYSDCIVDRDLNPEIVRRIAWDLPVLSTIPPYSYCFHPGHQFRHQDVWISTECRTKSMTITYNGLLGDRHYRASNLWNTTHTEYGFKPVHVDAVHVRKPLWTDCDCQHSVIRMGRYGRFQKAVLAHEAFFQARDYLKTLTDW